MMRLYPLLTPVISQSLLRAALVVLTTFGVGSVSSEAIGLDHDNGGTGPIGSMQGIGAIPTVSPAINPQVKPLVNDVLKVNLIGVTSNSDQIAIRWDATATTGFDPRLEATKLFNAGSVNLSFTSGTRAMSILAEPFPTVMTSYPLSVNVPTAGQYRITFENYTTITNASWAVYLLDANSNTYRRVGDTTNYVFNLAAAGTYASRFSLVVNPSGPLGLFDLATEDKSTFALCPNPANQSLTIRSLMPAKVDAPYQIVNSLGQVVQTTALPAGQTMVTLQIGDLAAGIYSVISPDQTRVKFLKQ
jgi:trimeric autotransporter adhesin